MNIFVAAWYYPPVTSSEGIVTYKLLRKSKNQYDVFSSLSKNWSYKSEFSNFEEPNIRTYSIDTDDIMVWVDACISKFEELYPSRKYDCIMTRSTPPESILVGLKIKEKHPEVKWVASFADPVANNPYDLKHRVDEYPLLKEREKKALKKALKDPDLSSLKPWRKRPENGIQVLCDLKEWETEAINKADLIICPTQRQLNYLGGEGGWKSNYFALPHCYCSEYYDETDYTENERIVFTYTGYSDELRSLRPFVDAVNQLKRSGSAAYGKFLFRFVGNTPRAIEDLILNFNLYDCISVEPSVDYFESLKILQQSDWLLHVDAYFPELEPGGSIFFAGKLADYIGAQRPIIALTGKGSPADKIVSNAGGITIDQNDVDTIASTIERICLGSITTKPDCAYRGQYESEVVAGKLDNKLKSICEGELLVSQTSRAISAENKKILSICVPSYNVQRCLDRCLYTLTKCNYAPYLDIIVVDDGSKDETLKIAKDYEKKYPGIVRAVHKENGGHGSTINVAIDKALGYYFRVVDADDWIDSSEQDKVLEKIINGEIDTDVISANYHIVNLESGSSFPIVQDCAVEYDKALPLSEIDTNKVYFTMAGSIIKTDILRKMNMKLQENTFFVDVEFILFPVPYLHTVTFLDSYIYKYSQGSSEQSVHIPNMVRRYDHHERVMKRILEYRNSVDLDPYQKNYYDSILKRVLYTHYGLCTVYAEDKEKSYKLLKDFDIYLQDVSPDMYEWIGKAMPVVKVARRTDYQYSRIKYSPGNVINQSKQITKNYVKSHKNIAKKIMKNKYTYVIANSDFFTKGKGRAFRNKVMVALLKD